jgi:hypothetical protein
MIVSKWSEVLDIMLSSKLSYSQKFFKPYLLVLCLNFLSPLLGLGPWRVWRLKMHT